MNDTELDRLLRDQFARRDPPEGFAERVLSRLPKTQRPVRPWRPLLAVAASAALACAGLEYHRHQQADRARRELMQALEITAEKLSIAQHKVKELNQRSILQ